MALAQTCPSDNLHIVDLPYRLSSWALDYPENIGLWFDENQQLVGWAVLQTPFWTIDYVCHSSAEATLHPVILAWAEQRAWAIRNTAAGRAAWFVMAFAGQDRRIHDLETAGFRCQAEVGENSWSKVLMQRSAPTPVRVYKPPVGYSVRSLAGDSEAAAYVELHQTVFESKNMTVPWRLRTLRQTAYKRDLDIVVETPTGGLAAFCICWFDETTSHGQVEPLGCHPKYRALGLGRVALSEGLRRLQVLGAKSIWVETDSYRNTAFQLYESFDFRVVRDVLVYRKDYASSDEP